MYNGEINNNIRAFLFHIYIIHLYVYTSILYLYTHPCIIYSFSLKPRRSAPRICRRRIKPLNRSKRIPRQNNSRHRIIHKRIFRGKDYPSDGEKKIPGKKYPRNKICPGAGKYPRKNARPVNRKQPRIITYRITRAVTA